MMNDKLLELENQVARLTIEVRRLRRLILGVMILSGILLAIMCRASDAALFMVVVGAMLAGTVYVGATLITALGRRAQRKRMRHIL